MWPVSKWVHACRKVCFKGNWARAWLKGCSRFALKSYHVISWKRGGSVDHVKILCHVEIKQREISWWETQQDAPQPFTQTDRSYVAQRTRIHLMTHTLNCVLVHFKRDVAYVNKLWIYKEVWQVYIFQFWLSWHLVQIRLKKGAYTSSYLRIYSQVVVQGNILCCTFTITHNGDIYPNLSHPLLHSLVLFFILL